METYYPLFYIFFSVAIAVFSIVAVFKLRNSKSEMEASLTGIWVNDSQTMRILMHHFDSIFQGDVIWVNSDKPNQPNILGAKLIKDLELKQLFQGSAGIYVDLESGLELPFRLWFNGKGRLKFDIIERVDGKDKVVKVEKWFRI